VKKWLGGHTSKYYEICKAIVKVYLLNVDPRKQAVVLTGASCSGKSTIAGYLAAIFSSHTLSQNTGGFEDEMER
jgi:energy-coupling factor transporter ATP-binding protein EcfA2